MASAGVSHRVSVQAQVPGLAAPLLHLRETSFYHEIHRSVHSCAVSRLGRHGYQEVWNRRALASLVIGLRGREAPHLSYTTVQTGLRFVLK